MFTSQHTVVHLTTSTGETLPCIIKHDYGSMVEVVPLYWLGYSDSQWWDSYYASKEFDSLPTELHNKWIN